MFISSEIIIIYAVTFVAIVAIVGILSLVVIVIYLREVILISGKAKVDRNKGDAGKKGGKRRQVGKKVNFEPDSAFRGS